MPIFLSGNIEGTADGIGKTARMLTGVLRNSEVPGATVFLCGMQA